MTELKLGSVVTIATKATDKSGRELPRDGTIVAISGESIWVLLTTGDIWVGTTRQVYTWQPTQ